MRDTPPSQRCGRCGTVLSGYAPDGLCAACLLESAFEAGEGELGKSPAAGPILAFRDYELLEEIARGGMGVVYRARQLSLNRPVAIKMILGGHLANAAEMKRFRAEAETAAQLQHPNIVAIHEVGEHAGQPFFSMDLVQGQNLAQLVRAEPLPARKAATYLKTIAEAVQYAHSRGVLHRDLKPSNILIDENEEPRVTDFGLAKRFSTSAGTPGTASLSESAKVGDVVEQTPVHELTQTGQVLGSPSFIPPEQAAGQKSAIGPASDVYSLGAILYHCLTARPPFMADSLAQTLRLVAEQEPVSPRLLNGSVPRDVETICLKCLEKDPQKRYISARALAEDLERFLRDEPIQARPVTRIGRVHRWCLRNKPLAISGTAILALLLVVAIGSPIAAIRIYRERLQAEANQRKAQAFAEFLSTTLESAGPSMTRGRDKTMMMEVLDSAARRVGNALTNQPEVEAEVRMLIGKVYIDLDDPTNALAMTKEALRLRTAHFGPRHISVAQTLNNLGAIMAEMGDLKAAEIYDRQALDLKIALLGKEDTDVATTMSNLGYRLQSRGDYAGAEPLLREALRIRLKLLPPNHADVALNLNNLAMVRWSRGAFDEAESLFHEALAIFQKLYPGDHRAVATMLNNVGEILRMQGRLEEAEIMTHQALAMRERVLGLTNAYTAYTEHNLGTLLERQGKLEQAEVHHQHAVRQLKALLGTNHSFVAEALCAYAVALVSKGDLAGAEAMQKEALATADRALGENNPAATEPRERLGTILAVCGRFTEAGACLTNTLSILRNSVGDEHPDLVSALRHLAWLHQQLGNAVEAESFHSQARAIILKGGNYGIRAFTDSNYDLADLLQARGRFADAEPLLLENASYLDSRPEAKEIFERVLVQRLVRFYEAWTRSAPHSAQDDQAVYWRQKLERLAPRTLPTP